MKRALLLLPFLFGFELFQSANRAIESGNAQLKSGKPEQALAEYDKAAKTLPAEPGVHFDRGAALYALSRFDEATQEFLRATEAKTTSLKAAAFYNLGNTFFKTDKFADAIAAYRRSLLLDPNDIKAKWNLELALKKKKDEDQKNKDKQSKDDKNKDKSQQDKDKQDKKDEQAKNDQKPDDKQDKKDEQKQDQKPDDKQDKKDEQKQDQAKTEQQKQEEKKQEQAKQEQAKQEQAKEAKADKNDKGADMREIEAVLDSLERSPKNLEQERARLRAIRRQPPSKDW